SPRLLARFLGSKRMADAAKAQLLFVLTAREDAALAEGYRRLIVSALTGVSRRVPAKAEIVGFLKEVAQARPQVTRWTDPTRLRWAEGFRLVLREAGFLITGPGNQARGGYTSRPRAGLRLHPGVRHGAPRRRRCEGEQPHYVSWRPAEAGDAEWMFGKSRTRLAPALTKASSWMSDRRTQNCPQRRRRLATTRLSVFSFAAFADLRE